MMKKYSLLLVLFFAASQLVFAQKPRLFVLTVGVSQYQSTSIRDLRYADDDARDLAEAFKKQTPIWNVQTVKTLTDAQATRDRVRDEIRSFKPLVRHNDFFIFAFSGHGSVGRLLTHDADSLDLEKTTLSKGFILELLNELPCGYMVFLDACFSGLIPKSTRLPNGKSQPVSKAEQGKIDRELQGMLETLGETDKINLIFASSGSDQESWECVPCQNGYFAQAFLDALDNKPVAELNLTFFPDQDGDQKLTPHELDTYLKRAVRIQTAESGLTQKVISRVTMGDELKLFSVKKTTVRDPDLPTDTDGDGVSDKTDDCPSQPGPAANRGCPKDDSARDLADWKTAKAANTEAAYRKYLQDHENGEFAELAVAALQRIADQTERDRDNLAYQIAEEKNTEAAFQKYLDNPKNKLHRDEATRQRDALRKPDNMILIKGGTFQMGSNDGESDEKPIHTVTVSDFYLSKFELTVAEFRVFIEAAGGYQTDAEKEGHSWKWTGKWEKMEGINWRHDAEGNTAKDNHPVIHVSHNDATAYCEWLSKKTGKTYRLPTEAEWEYAAGNGSRHTKFSWGNGDPTGKKGGNVADKTAKAKFPTWTTFENYTDGYVFTAPVGSFDANDFGLHDMTGNVWEWCSDWYDSDYYKNSPAKDPTGASSGSHRVLRGGSWDLYPLYCRVADRSYSTPGVRSGSIGFRLARTY